MNLPLAVNVYPDRININRMTWYGLGTGNVPNKNCCNFATILACETDSDR